LQPAGPNFIYMLRNINYHRLRQLWADLREAIAGTDRDFTKEPMGRAMFLLAVPMVLEMFMESVFAIVDIFFVSRLGSDAIATVGLTESLMTIIYAIGGGFAAATTALISRRIGEKEPEKAAISAVQAIFTGLAFSILIAIPGFILSRDVLRLMGGNENMINNMGGYTTIMISANAAIMLLFIINAVFRSSGDAAISMRVLFIANLINIVLDPCFIFGWGPFPALGVEGAAVATSIGRGTAVVYQFYLLFAGKRRIHISFKQLIPDWKVMWSLIKLSLGGIGQSLIVTSSWIFLVRIISGFGSSVIAAYTIAIRIVIFSLMPPWGLSNAAATLVGQNLGASKPERAERAIYMASVLNVVFMGLISLLFIFTPQYFVQAFMHGKPISLDAIICLRIVSYGFVFYALGMVMMQSLNGAGDTITPTIINFFCFWMIEIPLAWLLSSRTSLHEQGVYISIVVAESIMATTGLIIIRNGKWKMNRV
jgi:putative MATE family efflux protein